MRPTAPLILAAGTGELPGDGEPAREAEDTGSAAHYQCLECDRTTHLPA